MRNSAPRRCRDSFDLRRRAVDTHVCEPLKTFGARARPSAP